MLWISGRFSYNFAFIADYFDVIIKKEQVYLQANKVNKAILEVERLIKYYPTDLKYKGMLADLYLSKKDDQKANEIYNEILRQDPENGYANIALSEYYRSKKENDLAYSYLKKAIASPDLEIKYKIQTYLQKKHSKSLNRCIHFPH